MKKLLLLIITIFTLGANAQISVYHPFPDSAANWSVEYGGYESPQCYDKYYFIDGDTLINSLTYHKITYNGWNGFADFSTHLCAHFVYSPEHYYLGAIRQNTLLKKVYFILPGYTTDTLLYDFTLNVGDTLAAGINNSISPHTAYITSVDSILIGNNYRKRFNIANSLNVSIIEGIGSTTGLIEDVTVFEFGGTLDCFSQNNKPLYPDTNTTCALVLGLSEPKSNAAPAIISPNPLHTISLLSIGEEFEKAELKIYNSIGMLVNRETIINKSAIINREGWSDGIYFYRVTNSNGQVLTGRFIVN